MNDRILKNKLEATEYLQRRGYKVGKSKVYADAKQGMIRIQEDGTILARDIESYARAAGLQRPDMDGPDPKEVEDARKEKEELEAQMLRYKIEKERFGVEKLYDEHIRREEVELVWASHLAALDTKFKVGIKDNQKEWTYIAGGKPDFSSDLVQSILEFWDGLMNELSRMDKFKVVFENEDGDS